MKVSIIIPTLNEEENMERLLHRLLQGGGAELLEIIVVDGGSQDRTCSLAAEAGVKVFRAPHKGRARQMNYGAARSSGDLLYFVHGDTLPPESYIADIRQALSEGFPLGCYRFRFESDKWILKLNSYCTRFDRMWCRGGDQTLFVTRKIFEELKGYRDDHIIMEEYDFIFRAREKYPFKIMPKNVLVSARKYKANSYLKVQFANFLVFSMFQLGLSQERLFKTYKRLLYN